MKHSQIVMLVSIGVALLILVLIYWLFPVFAHYLQKQDCIAAGYSSCVQ